MSCNHRCIGWQCFVDSLKNDPQSSLILAEVSSSFASRRQRCYIAPLHCTIYNYDNASHNHTNHNHNHNKTKATKAGNQTKAGNHTKSAPQISRNVEKYLNVSLFSLSTGNSGKSFSNIDFRNIHFGKSTICSPKVLMWNPKLMI